MDTLELMDYLATSDYGFWPDEDGAEHADLVAAGYGTVRVSWASQVAVQRFDAYATPARLAAGIPPARMLIWEARFDGEAPALAVLATIASAAEELAAEAGWGGIAADRPTITLDAQEARELRDQWFAAADGMDGDDAEHDAASDMAAMITAGLEAGIPDVADPAMDAIADRDPGEASRYMAEPTEAEMRAAELDAHRLRHGDQVLAPGWRERLESRPGWPAIG